MEKEIKTISLIKLTLVGGSCDGKTCLCYAFLGDKLREITLPTFGRDMFEKKMIMSDGNEVKIKIMDTPGIERLRPHPASILGYSNGVIVVFDITNKVSFGIVDYWLEGIRNKSKDIPVILFGNKCDLEEKREVSEEEAQRYADENDILYFETSAKYNIGVNEGFEAICEMIYKNILTEFPKDDKKSVITLTTLGNHGVGKTNICKVYQGLEFKTNGLDTINVNKLENKMTMPDGNKVTIKILDIGQERCRLAILKVLSPNGVIVVFDVTDKKSFEQIYYWLKQINKISEDIQVVLFGNKGDLDNREVSEEEAKQYADKNDILYFETSAKYNIGIKEGFETLCEIIYKKIYGNKKRKKNG